MAHLPESDEGTATMSQAMTDGRQLVECGMDRWTRTDHDDRRGHVSSSSWLDKRGDGILGLSGISTLSPGNSAVVEQTRSCGSVLMFIFSKPEYSVMNSF